MIKNLSYDDTDIFYINEIIDYWFGEKGTLHFQKWFHSAGKYDEEIRKKFGKILKEAEKGNLLHWLQSKEGYLAHIVLMDQFSRHIYRDTAEAYKNDKKALLFMEMALSQYLDEFNSIEQMFVLMPYQHCEDIECQRLGLKILNNLVDNYKGKDISVLKTALYHQKGHLKVIEKFKRFPKRNELLKRLSTMEEIDYMDNSEKLPY